ncbi:AsnC family transcriptional regulator [Derxia lacustris]|uniref:AsnC family transcriptional regulator n=1 Tax=Derxia lacustris TaxID=764842 RepID=UPI000A16CE5E|nr:Lrp/AsnC ligand binding domain-containing protein [Derxia lacustris]
MRNRTQTTRDLDRIDIKLLDELQRDGRMPVTELAERVGLSVTPCAERIRRMEREGVILGYTVRLSPQALHLPLLVFVELKLSAKSGSIFEKFRREVESLPGVLECHLVSGDFDYLVKARISEIGAYRKMLGEVLLNLPGVTESRSYFVMEEIKETTALPLPVPEGS